MTAYTAGFDPIEYSKQLRNAGVSQEQADIQAQTIEHVFNNILQQAKQESKELFNDKELATKSDLEKVKLELQKEIAKVSNKTIIWIGSLLLASGLIQHFFK